MTAALRFVADDAEHQDAADAAMSARRSWTRLALALDAGDWSSIAEASEAAYLEIGRLAALARAASSR